MSSGRVLWHLVKADFLTRVRRTSFLVTLAFAVFLGYQTFAGNVQMQLDDYRGVYNSAWVGALMGVVTSTFLTLAGFYIVKGSILRDETTRVGQILAATPMSKGFYTVAKCLGNFAVLAAMVASDGRGGAGDADDARARIARCNCGRCFRRCCSTRCRRWRLWRRWRCCLKRCRCCAAAWATWRGSFYGSGLMVAGVGQSATHGGT